MLIIVRFYEIMEDELQRGFSKICKYGEHVVIQTSKTAKTPERLSSYIKDG